MFKDYKVMCIILILLPMFLCFECDSPTSSDKNEDIVEIISIIENPDDYSNEKVVIDGHFGGWEPDVIDKFHNMRDKLFQNTYSDCIIYDSTGYIFMDANSENSIEMINWKYGEFVATDSAQIGSKLKIKSPVSIVNSKPILGVVK